MRTKVHLKLTRTPSKRAMAQVLSASKENTAEPDGEVEILPDETDKKALIIKFDSPKGSQDYLAGKIMKSYHYVDTYNDISISFETKRNKID